jgi:predicted nucleotidyltransferase
MTPTSKESLAATINETVASVGVHAQTLVREAVEVVVFGSAAAGLNTPNSDLDILCVGGSDTRLKTPTLDVLAVPVEAITNPTWLHSEIASHISKYGVWALGSGGWRADVSIGAATVAHKQRRIAAFMGSLPRAWFELQECFRLKYSTKLRRETQRLILLERGIAIPPTRILDDSWTSLFGSSEEVYLRLRRLAHVRERIFETDLFERISMHFEQGHPVLAVTKS